MRRGCLHRPSAAGTVCHAETIAISAIESRPFKTIKKNMIKKLSKKLSTYSHGAIHRQAKESARPTASRKNAYSKAVSRRLS